MAKFEKCPHCGAWRLQGELANHIGSCIMYSKPKAGKNNPSPAGYAGQKEVIMKDIRGAEMKRLHGVEKRMGVDCKVYANTPDDAIYTVVSGEKNQVIDLSEENWEDDDDLAKLIYDRLD